MIFHLECCFLNFRGIKRFLFVTKMLNKRCYKLKILFQDFLNKKKKKKVSFYIFNLTRKKERNVYFKRVSNPTQDHVRVGLESIKYILVGFG